MSGVFKQTFKPKISNADDLVRKLRSAINLVDGNPNIIDNLYFDDLVHQLEANGIRVKFEIEIGDVIISAAGAGGGGGG